MACEGAILDCDGTLVDTLGAWRSVEDMLSKEAQVLVTQEDRAQLTTFTLDETAQWFHTRFGLGASGAAVRGLIDDYMIDYLSHSTKVLPGVEAFLEACRQEGVALSVASSSPQRYLQVALKSVDLLQYLSHVLSVEDVGHSKREPVIYNHACELMGTNKLSTWGFDDSLYAIRTLKNAGFPTVGVYDEHEGLSFEDWKNHATLVVKSFEDLSLKELQQPRA